MSLTNLQSVFARETIRQIQPPLVNLVQSGHSVSFGKKAKILPPNLFEKNSVHASCANYSLHIPAICGGIAPACAKEGWRPGF